MRVALVTATPDNVAAGSGTYVAATNLKAGLEARGEQVHVIQPARALGTRAYALTRLLFNARLSAAAVRGCDLLCGLDLDGWLLADRTGLPYAAYLHGVIADEARFERGLARCSLKTQSLAERSAARRAGLVLATSNYSARRITELYGVDSSRIRLVPPGFDGARWDRALAEATRGPGRQGPTVLSVGRMYPRKNHAALLRATAALLPAFPGLEVRVVGDGPERPRLDRLAQRLGIERSVRFLGQVSFAQLVNEYVASDVFCLPSLQEGFGIVFAEAMAAGKPIVACDAGATPEVVVHGENGILAEPRNDGALVKALRALLENPGLRQRLAETNRTQARRRFGLEVAAERFLEAVRPLVTGAAASGNCPIT